MIESLKQLEYLLEKQSIRSNFSQSDLLIYPDIFRIVHSFKVFGENLLSVPPSLIVDGNDDDYEIPFSFTNSVESITIFESEFRPEIPINFVQIGNLFGSDIMLLNVNNNQIYVFNIADISDTDWLKYKLENPICDLNKLIESIQLQTVCCLINPKNHSEWKMIEIRATTIITDDFEKEFDSTTTTWEAYHNIVKSSIQAGYKIHYAPQKIINAYNESVL